MPNNENLFNIKFLNGRYDLYGPVHKGLRRAQCDLLVRLGAADFTADSARAELLADLRALLALAASHLLHEEGQIHPNLVNGSAEPTARLNEQHGDHRRKFDELEELIVAVEQAPKAQKHQHGRRLYLAFTLYLARDLEHMFEEEVVAAPILHASLSDQELRTIEANIVGSLSPEKSMAFMQLMIPAINPAERVALLAGIKTEAPPEVFDAIVAFAARPSLSASEFDALARDVGIAA